MCRAKSNVSLTEDPDPNFEGSDPCDDDTTIISTKVNKPISHALNYGLDRLVNATYIVLYDLFHQKDQTARVQPDQTYRSEGI